MTTTDNERVYSVFELNAAAKACLENALPYVLVEGELSNVVQPASGHLYFTLKDDRAQIRCAMFRSRNRTLTFKPKEGCQVLARASVSLYEARGDYQLILHSMEDIGDGRLRRKFEQLKQKLHQEGLFDEQHKQPLPEVPSRIGIVTSSTGAAIRDIISVFKRRYPSALLILYPTLVQGAEAADDIVATLKIANQRNEVDCLILGRGGGSLEDLWPFNEEKVARAIFASRLPIVSAVGHEIDFTIADFVADMRAPTPSAAAELLSPDQKEWLRQLTQWQQRLFKAISHPIIIYTQQLAHFTKRLKHPGQRIQEWMQMVDEQHIRLMKAFKELQLSRQKQLASLATELIHQSPSTRIQQHNITTAHLAERLTHAMHNKLQDKQQRFGKASGLLHAVSPLSTLQRGYAIVFDAKGKSLIRNVKQVKVGGQIQVELQEGHLDCTIDRVSNQKKVPGTRPG